MTMPNNSVEPTAISPRRVCILRQPSYEPARVQSIEITKLILQMQQIGDIARNDPDKELSFEEIQTFLLPF